jgi:predicted dienelactone hydrolase
VLFQQVVAADAPISGSQLPLIVISHGTGGGAETHYDTALALAEAGFIAVAATHPGDNWRDHALSFTARNFIERARHLKLTIDYMLTAWSGRGHVAAKRIGAFGHSAGGFTVLVAVGGNPELARLDAYCREHPDDWGCQRARALARGSTGDPPAPIWVHDERIKAAVVAAPAAGHAFTAVGLAPVAAPVQLWEAEDDRIAPNRWSAENVRANLPSPPELHVVPRADHFAFLAPCGEALAVRVPEICREPPGFDRTALHHDLNEAVVAFFRKQLGPLAAIGGRRPLLYDRR